MSDSNTKPIQNQHLSNSNFDFRVYTSMQEFNSKEY